VLLVDCNGRFFFCPIDHLLCQNLETVSFPRLPFSISPDGLAKPRHVLLSRPDPMLLLFVPKEK